MKSDKKLYRSTDNKVIYGVIGGFAEYFEIDPVLLRVIYVGLSAFTGLAPGALAYFFMAAIMPKKEHIIYAKPETKEGEAPIDK